MNPFGVTSGRASGIKALSNQTCRAAHCGSPLWTREQLKVAASSLWLTRLYYTSGQCDFSIRSYHLTGDIWFQNKKMEQNAQVRRLKKGTSCISCSSWNRCKILIKTESCDSFDCRPLSWFKANMKFADKPKRVFSQRRRCNGLKRFHHCIIHLCLDGQWGKHTAHCTVHLMCLHASWGH